VKVVEFLNEESKWIKYHSAVNKDGVSVQEHDENACRWCLSGAIIKCYGYCTKEEIDVTTKINGIIDRKTGFRITIADFNDLPKTTFVQIKEILQEANV
jgi:hypothetical protein